MAPRRSELALRLMMKSARLAVRLARRGKRIEARKARSDAALCLRYAVDLAAKEREV